MSLKLIGIDPAIAGRDRTVRVSPQTVKVKFKTVTIARLFGGQTIRTPLLCALAIDVKTGATLRRLTSMAALDRWLREEGFSWVFGSNGLWSRSVIG